MTSKPRYTSRLFLLRQTNDKHPSRFFNCLFGQGSGLIQQKEPSSVRVWLNGLITDELRSINTITELVISNKL